MESPLVDKSSPAAAQSPTRRAAVHVGSLLVHRVSVDVEEGPNGGPPGLATIGSHVHGSGLMNLSRA